MPKARKKTNKTKKTSWRAKLLPKWNTGRGKILAFVAVFAIVGAGTLFLAHAATLNATGTITGIASKCLTPQNGDFVQLWACNGSAVQQWTFPGDGTVRDRGFCLDVKDSGLVARTPVQIYTCNGSGAQQWALDTSKGQLMNPESGLCLDDEGARATDGNTIWIWRCNGTNAQQWTVPSGATTGPGSGTGVGTKPIGVGGTWKMVLDDEFNGSTINTALWSQSWRGGNKAGTFQPDSGNDRTCYSPSHDVVAGGEVDLKVTSTPHACKTYVGTAVNYTSGILLSKKNYGYGYYSARIWLPTGSQMWPAWWLFNGYSAGHGEIDVEEAYGNTSACATYHGPSGDALGGCKTMGSGWHTYDVLWLKGKLTIYYDGKAFGTTTKAVPSAAEQLILNLEVGPANSSKSTISNAKVPNAMRIDYVRGWQQ